jgi:hypothetical protein
LRIFNVNRDQRQLGRFLAEPLVCDQVPVTEKDKGQKRDRNRTTLNRNELD